MYQNYFGLSAPPFENNLDQRFLFFSANHKEVFAALLYFIKLKKSFAMVCGDVGTGKTMLIHSLLNRLPKTCHPIMIMNPAVGYLDILRYVAGILKIDTKGVPMLELVDCVKAELVAASQRGERFVLIIDEAHLLPDASIEQIRLLSNIETQEYKLFQILLLGQYELSYKLDRPEMRQIRQRINVNRFLAPMDDDETIRYIDHRLKMAGSGYEACFEANCKDLIFKMTGGVPRSINQLCDNALLACMTQKRHRIDRKILKTAGTVIQSDILYTPKKHAAVPPGPHQSIRLLAVFGAVFLVLGAAGIAGYWGAFRENANMLLQGVHPRMPLSTPAMMLPAADPMVSPKVNHRSASNIAPPTIALPSPAPPPESPVPEIAEASGVSPPQPPESTSPLRAVATPLPEVRPADLVHPQPTTAEKKPQLENWQTRIQKSKKILIKNGDTLMEIASRYYPEDTAAGLRKILTANPFITDVNWIYEGQELVLPGIVPDREDGNR